MVPIPGQEIQGSHQVCNTKLVRKLEFPEPRPNAKLCRTPKPMRNCALSTAVPTQLNQGPGPAQVLSALAAESGRATHGEESTSIRG